MESDWRFGVWAVGLWGSYTLKAAIVDEVIPGVAFPVLLEAGPAGNGIYDFVPPQVPTFVAGVGPSPGFPHFPWGVPVFPDNAGLW